MPVMVGQVGVFNCPGHRRHGMRVRVVGFRPYCEGSKTTLTLVQAAAGKAGRFSKQTYLMRPDQVLNVAWRGNGRESA